MLSTLFGLLGYDKSNYYATVAEIGTHIKLTCVEIGSPLPANYNEWFALIRDTLIVPLYQLKKFAIIGGTITKGTKAEYEARLKGAAAKQAGAITSNQKAGSVKSRDKKAAASQLTCRL